LGTRIFGRSAGRGQSPAGGEAPLVPGCLRARSLLVDDGYPTHLPVNSDIAQKALTAFLAL